MTEQKNTPKEQGAVSSETNSSSTNSRRGFLTKVAIAAPLLTTIASRPVWAGQCSLSGNLSNNVSNHDHPENCSILGYSPGGWCSGHANNNNLWQYVGLTANSPLSALFLTYSPTSFDNFPDGPIATIQDALKKNGGGKKGACSDGNYDNLGTPDNDNGLWRQRTAAALNSLLWLYMKNDCENNPSCLFLGNSSPVNELFYYTWTLADIMGKDEYALKTTHDHNLF